MAAEAIEASKGGLAKLRPAKAHAVFEIFCPSNYDRLGREAAESASSNGASCNPRRDNAHGVLDKFWALK